MNYSLEWLQSQIAKGNQLEFCFFWGHTQKTPGVTDKSCLSQWWPATFRADGIDYPTAEHWMMVKKALLFGDEAQYKQILTTDSPAKAKKCGRAVQNFDPAVWQANAYQFVVEGNKHKFSQHADLKAFLLATKDTVIVEASPFDKIWAIGTRAHETDPFKWKGSNLLGFALMEVRDYLNGK